jgi:hypothetical protein
MKMGTLRMDNREAQFTEIAQLGASQDDAILFFPPVNERYGLQLSILHRCATFDPTHLLKLRMALVGDELSIRVENKSSIKHFVRDDFVNGGPYRLASACWVYTPSLNCMGWQSVAEGWMVLRVSATIPISDKEIFQADRRFARHYIEIGNQTQPTIREYTISILEGLPLPRRERLMKRCGLS